MGGAYDPYQRKLTTERGDVIYNISSEDALKLLKYDEISLKKKARKEKLKKIYGMQIQ